MQGDLINAPVGRATHPPWLPTTLSWLAAASSAALLLAGTERDGFLTPFLGWLLGGVGTVLCFICHRWVDRDRRRDPHYSRTRLAGPVAAGAPFAGVVIAGVHAWNLAWYLAQWFPLRQEALLGGGG